MARSKASSAPKTAAQEAVTATAIAKPLDAAQQPTREEVTDFECAITVGEIMQFLGRDGSLRGDNVAFSTMIGIRMTKDGQIHLGVDQSLPGEAFDRHASQTIAIANSRP